jgi:hypothetical protein
MQEQKFNYLTSDPENPQGHEMLISKYSLTRPNKTKYGRHVGGISQIDLERLGIGSRQGSVTCRPRRLLPKTNREDPFAPHCQLSDSDLSDGVLSLQNRGFIPRDVDVGPCINRSSTPLSSKSA